MNELIKVDEKGKTTARELYEFLELRLGDFSRWCKSNIDDNQFAEENKDYEVFRINEENPQGGRPGKDYLLSIDFAKKLCMISKSKRGEQARDYFIEVEKRFKQQVVILPSTYAEALRELASTWEREQETIKQLEAAKPKVEFFDAVAESKDAIPMGDAAKVLNMGIGRNKLFSILRQYKILMKNNRPYQEYVDRGYFRVIEQKYSLTSGDTRIDFRTLVYQRGLDFIRKFLQQKTA